MREKPNIKDMGTPVSGKDATVVFPVNPVIRDVLHNGIGFLFIDEPNDLWINSSGLFLNIKAYLPAGFSKWRPPSAGSARCSGPPCRRGHTQDGWSELPAEPWYGSSHFRRGSPRPSSCSFISSFWRPTVAVYCSSETNSLSFHSQTYLKFLASHYAIHQGITSYNFIYVLIVCLKMFSAAFISYTNLSYGSTLSGIFSPSFITQISSLALTFFS